MKALLIGMESLPGTPKMREPPSNALGHREPSGMRRGLRCFSGAAGFEAVSMDAWFLSGAPHRTQKNKSRIMQEGAPRPFLHDSACHYWSNRAFGFGQSRRSTFPKATPSLMLQSPCTVRPKHSQEGAHLQNRIGLTSKPNRVDSRRGDQSSWPPLKRRPGRSMT